MNSLFEKLSALTEGIGVIVLAATLLAPPTAAGPLEELPVLV